MSYTVFLIHPGAAWSTHDVWVGMRAGFEANGCTVYDYRLDEMLAFYGSVFDAAKLGGLVWDKEKRPNVAGFAALKSVAELVFHPPDLLVSVSGHNLHQLTPMAARKMGVPSVVYCTESPYFRDKEHGFARSYDIILTNERLSVPSFAAACEGRIVEYLPHAYNPALHTPADPDPAYASDVFFVGSGFQERRMLFDAVDWTGIDFQRRGFLWTQQEDASGLDASKVLPNEEAVKYYRASKINLNHHRTTTVYGAYEHISSVEAASLNPRAYEIAACGGFQISDNTRPELTEIFGDTVPTYRSSSALDLERVIRRYLARPDERDRLAAAQHEAIRPHTWTARAARILELATALPQRKAVA